MIDWERYWGVSLALDERDKVEAARVSEADSPLRLFRLRHHFDQHHLAELLGVSEATVRNYERGRTPRRVILALAALEDMFDAGR